MPASGHRSVSSWREAGDLQRSPARLRSHAEPLKLRSSQLNAARDAAQRCPSVIPFVAPSGSHRGAYCRLHDCPSVVRIRALRAAGCRTRARHDHSSPNSVARHHDRPRAGAAGRRPGQTGGRVEHGARHGPFPDRAGGAPSACPGPSARGPSAFGRALRSRRRVFRPSAAIAASAFTAHGVRGPG